MEDQLLIRLSEDGADDERLGTLTGHLSRDLVELDDVEVSQARGEAPPNTRSVDAVEVGGLVVTLVGSGALQQVVSAIRRWLGRGAAQEETARTVRVELDGDTLELTGASSQEQDRLIQLFVLRHLKEPTTS